MAKSLWWIRGLACVVIAASSAFGQGILLAEAPWRWVVPAHPVDAASIRSYGGRGIVGDEVGCLLDFNKENTLELIVGYQRSAEAIKPEYRVVVFDKSGRRSVVKAKFGPLEGMFLSKYELSESISADSISYFGIEKLDADGWSQLSSKMAPQYRAQNIQTLPFPSVGQPYTFALAADHGKAISSDQLQGRVVVIVCWVAPLVPEQQMGIASLKSLCDELGESRLAVLGINFNPPESEKMARWYAGELGMPWPQVFVSPDAERLSAWHDVATIGQLRTFVLDQSGVLRVDTTLVKDYEFVRRFTSSN